MSLKTVKTKVTSLKIKSEGNETLDIINKNKVYKNLKKSYLRQSIKAECIQHRRNNAIRLNGYTAVQRKGGKNKNLVLFGTVKL